MKIFTKKFFLFFISLYTLGTFYCLAGDIVYGKDIKQQAQKYFEAIGLEANVLISDRRAFFYCSSELKFVPRVESFLDNSVSGATTKVVSLARNISKGQVLDKNDLVLVEIPEQSNFESFVSFDKLIGRKITSNLARGTVLKARHLKHTTSVNKNDTVLVVFGNNKLSITTYGTALASGQKGDMITIVNQNSKKTFKAIVIGEKKVTPLANM